MRKWTLDDVHRLRELLIENDWKTDVAIQLYCAETNANGNEKIDIERTARVLLKGNEFDKRMAQRHAKT